jgi:hypothetical protein
MPVRRKKKKSSKAVSMAQGIAWQAAKGTPAALVRIAGIIVGVLGAFITVLGFFLMVGCFTGNFLVGLVVMTLTIMCYFGTRAALGFGLKVSQEYVWEGTGSIFVGIVLTVVSGFFILAVLGMALIAARHAGRREMPQPNWQPPPHLRRF